MKTAGDERNATEASRRCLTEGIAALTVQEVERRHEALMAWAESELGLTREYAEQVYALAGEEALEPAFGLLLVRCGIGVRELERPDPDGDEEASQQTPPDWLSAETVELDDIMLERRLRASFRRLKAHLADSSDPAAAIAAFLEEPDIGQTRLRQ